MQQLSEPRARPRIGRALAIAAALLCATALSEPNLASAVPHGGGGGGGFHGGGRGGFRGGGLGGFHDAVIHGYGNGKLQRLEHLRKYRFDAAAQSKRLGGIGLREQ